MPKFAANVTFLFTELPILDRFAAARRAGFNGVEMLFPYDLSANIMAKAAQAADVEFVLMNTPPPNWAGGPRGFAAVPNLKDRFRHDFNRALRYGQVLHIGHIHIMAGPAKGPEAHQCFVDNLKWAADRAPHASLTIEPMNPADMPDYFLSDFDQAADILAEIGAPNIGLQFDAYHAHVITKDVITTWHKHADKIRHIQISGSPGRHEPQGPDIDFPDFFKAVDATGYKGWISAEYSPRTTTEAGLGWLPQG